MNNNLYNNIINNIAIMVKKAINEAYSNDVNDYDLNEEYKWVKAKWIDLNKDNIKDYINSTNHLSDVRINKKLCGWMVVKENKLVGYCGYEDNVIKYLEVMEPYRKLKWATKLLKKAKTAGCTEVKIEKNHRPAISLYFKNGFYIYGSNKHLLFMKLRLPKN